MGKVLDFIKFRVLRCTWKNTRFLVKALKQIVEYEKISVVNLFQNTKNALKH